MNFAPIILTLALAVSPVDSTNSGWTQAEMLTTPNAAPMAKSVADETTSTVAESVPAQLVTRALEPSQATPLAGRPVTLLSSLAATRAAGQQAAVVHAYWDAMAMVAQYNLRSRELAVLRGVTPRPGDEPMMRAAQASAEAALDEAAIAAVTAQHALALHSLMPMALGGLPLPSDRPCVGLYETRFNQVFANRPVPEQAWLMNQTLPLRQEVIEHRAKAIKAAEEALDASRRDYAAGSVSFERVLAALAAWARQEDAFMQSVCEYNHNIAEYVAAVRVGPTDNATLVSMLIGRPLVPQPETLVPVGAAAFTGSPTPAGPPPWQGPKPTLAPPLNPVRPAEHIEPLPRALEPNQSTTNTTGRSVMPLDVTPDLFPIEGKLVPVRPNTESPTRAPNQTAEQQEAPKVRVIPIN